MDQNQPTTAQVSVILPTLNDEEFIEECISGVVDQTFEYFELFVIDGGSTDGTVEIVESMDDTRITVLEGGGFVASLQKGIEHSDGKYIARVDSDTVSTKDRFEKQVNYLDTHQEVAVLGGQLLQTDGETEITNSRPTSPDAIRRQILDRCPVHHPTVMMRRSALEKAGGYRDVPMEDYELWTRFINNRLKIVNLDDVLAKEYLRDDSIISSTPVVYKHWLSMIYQLKAVRGPQYSFLEKLYFIPYIILFETVRTVYECISIHS